MKILKHGSVSALIKIPCQNVDFLSNICQILFKHTIENTIEVNLILVITVPKLSRYIK